MYLTISVSGSTDVQVVLAVYPSFTTGADLLQELKSCFKHTPREHAHIVRPGCVGFILSVVNLTNSSLSVIEILRQWVASESFDSTLGSELQRFLVKVTADPDFAGSQDIAFMKQKLARPPAPSDDDVRSPTVRPESLFKSGAHLHRD